MARQEVLTMQAGDRDQDGQAVTRFGARRTVILQTRKRDGTWIPTAVSLVTDGDRAYFRTYDASGKYKRLRNFSEVRIAPGTVWGKPTGPSIEGRARPLGGAEAERASSMLAAGFPVLQRRLVPWMHRRKGWATQHYEVTFSSEGHPA
jgi:PPOX class probable F420-dependent enzyme